MPPPTPQKSERVEIQVTEQIPLGAHHYANQYRTARDSDVISLFLGFGSSGQIASSVLLLVNSMTVNMNRESVTQYYDRLINAFPDGRPAEESPWIAASPTTYYGNFCDYSHFGPLAQIRLVYFSIRQLALAESRRETKVNGQTSCVIDMPVAIQLGILKKILFT